MNAINNGSYVSGESFTGVERQYMYALAALGERKELACSSETLNAPRSVSWYRTIDNNTGKCPNNTYFLNNREVFCDRLTNDRNIQNGFVERFSIAALRSENENGLTIASVEPSDVGTYACVDHDSSSNEIRVWISITVEDGQWVLFTVEQTLKIIVICA